MMVYLAMIDKDLSREIYIQPALLTPYQNNRKLPLEQLQLWNCSQHLLDPVLTFMVLLQNVLWITSDSMCLQNEFITDC